MKYFLAMQFPAKLSNGPLHLQQWPQPISQILIGTSSLWGTVGTLIRNSLRINPSSSHFYMRLYIRPHFTARLTLALYTSGIFLNIIQSNRFWTNLLTQIE